MGCYMGFLFIRRYTSIWNIKQNSRKISQEPLVYTYIMPKHGIVKNMCHGVLVINYTMPTPILFTIP